eukprot:TRINITY_DN25284_c0_g1_i1.p1 TRINITY_DN25284_c0_g1~~TRINITY_DN25284_c0_g1_i1.p1  ORF type:complete len:166 (-),score=4.86 TRINITY_DN25284_c0_g1_i1:19-516(-)
MYRRNFIKKTAILTAGLSLLGNNTKARQSEEMRVVHIPDPSKWNSKDLHIAWLGHSTILMNFYGKILITDPVFFNQIGLNILGIVIGPSRYSPPALTIEQIPKPDLVLLSHVLCVDTCLLYTSDAADDMQCVDLGGRRIIKKKKQTHQTDMCRRRQISSTQENAQ